jgi:hypothetical protein
MSSFTWLDYSEKQRKQILDVISQFREQSTRDELGLGTVRDVFADMLFPGTSTIQTRARYFLIVPWIYRSLEDKQSPSATIENKARKAELALIEKIHNSDDREGNIGRVAKLGLKRLPSSVYWQGLAVWGIRLFRGSQAQYHRSLDRYYLFQKAYWNRSEEDENDQAPPRNWHAGLEDPPSDFPDRCSLRLRSEEARYLREQIRNHCPESLLAILVSALWRPKETTFIWEHPYLAKFPDPIQEQLVHARNFSEVMHGPVLLYNLMLAEQEKLPDLVKAYRRSLSSWSAIVAARHGVFRQWDRDQFWAMVRHRNPRIGIRTRTFIDHFWDVCRDGKENNMGPGTRARQMVCERERALKGSLARINNPHAGKLWNGESAIGQIDFRWFFAQRILRDIFDGLDAK